MLVLKKLIYTIKYHVKMFIWVWKALVPQEEELDKLLLDFSVSNGHWGWERKKAEDATRQTKSILSSGWEPCMMRLVTAPVIYTSPAETSCPREQYVMLRTRLLFQVKRQQTSCINQEMVCQFFLRNLTVFHSLSLATKHEIRISHAVAWEWLLVHIIALSEVKRDFSFD